MTGRPGSIRSTSGWATCWPSSSRCAPTWPSAALWSRSTTRPPAPRSEERDSSHSFADQTALALDRAQALSDRAELAVISDRERIARDLHDVVIQRLFATGLQLQAIRSVAVNPEVSTRIDQTVDDLDLTIRDIRGTIFELQNRQSASLRAEVRTLVEEYVPVLGFTPTVRTSGAVDTAGHPDVRGHVLAVLREAVSNIARHALADHAEVDVEVRGDELVLAVVDDGAGLREGRSESGLRNARRRAQGLGGTLELSPGSRGDLTRVAGAAALTHKSRPLPGWTAVALRHYRRTGCALTRSVRASRFPSPQVSPALRSARTTRLIAPRMWSSSTGLFSGGRTTVHIIR